MSEKTDSYKNCFGELNVVTPEMLAMIERLGAVHFTPQQIADYYLAEFDSINAILTIPSTHSLYLHFKKGCLQSEFEIRESVFELAKRNSAPAQELAKRYISEQKSSMA